MNTPFGDFRLEEEQKIFGVENNSGKQRGLKFKIKLDLVSRLKDLEGSESKFSEKIFPDVCDLKTKTLFLQILCNFAWL